MNKPIAIIGMGSLFPKAQNLGEYWNNILHGVDAITDLPATHWSARDYFDADPNKPDFTYAQRGGFLSPYPFDPLGFGVPPSILEATDTSQLLGLVVAKAALEDAGYGEHRAFNRDKVSVILGVTGAMELVIPLGARLGHPIWKKALQDSGIDAAKTQEVVDRISDAYVPWQENSFPGLLGNVVAGRIANRLNLGGTNCVVDAACASSLSAAHLAVLELSSGKSDMVITGGVDTFNDIFMYMCFSKTPALSPTGDARPFDESADGTILGEGIGMVVLKRLEDAERDGDRIYAVIRGLGSSSDGRSKSIYAPRSEGQAKALHQAYAEGDVTPDSIELLEAHGTGTKAGDAAEIESLRMVFARDPDGEKSTSESVPAWCALGSVKSQIGHTKAAAGAAGLIKAALALHHKVLPPTIKVTQPSAKLKLETSPFYINTESRPWRRNDRHPRRAAISAFGFGGSNFHAVLEEHRNEKSEIAWDGAQEIVALSGATVAPIRASLTALRSLAPAQYLDFARTSREQFKATDAFRLVFVLEPTGGDSLLAKITAQLDANSASAWQLADGVYFGVGTPAGRTAFVFPGQGSQYVAMGRDLVCAFPQAQAALEAFDPGIAEKVFPRAAFTDSARRDQVADLTSTDVAQPALGAISAAWLRVLEYFGVRADATAGHSYGELTALFAAGRLDLANFVKLSHARGRLMKSAGATGDDAGAMLAVSAPLARLESLVRKHSLDLVVANRNAPEQGVLSGRKSEIAKAAALFKTLGVTAKELSVAAAFHSPLVAEASRPFAAEVRGAELRESGLPVYANSTAQTYPEDRERSHALLAEQLAKPVDFVGVVEALVRDGTRTFIEVGPRSTLSSLIRATLNDSGRSDCQIVTCDSSAGRRPALNDLARLLAQLAANGRELELARWQQPLRPATHPAPKTAAPKMTVLISGANHRTPSTKKIAAAPLAAAPFPTPPLPPAPLPAPMPAPANAQAESTFMSKDRPLPPKPTVYPLTAAQENLQALQNLNLQTAALHKKFLEGQEAAQAAYLRLFEEQLRGSQGYAPIVATPAATPVPAPVAAAPAVPAPAAFAATALTPAAVPAAAVPPVPAAPLPTGLDVAELARVLLAVVADKTGYPVETLQLDMDLESDLGIDSIKRVEILAGVREKIPSAPSVEPEHLGTLRTLQQIVTFIANKSQAAGGTAATTTAAPANRTVTSAAPSMAIQAPSLTLAPTPSPVAARIDRDLIAQTLLQVVADKTGYPVETLQLGMDLESDLGIDSIKRVEILAGLREKIPAAPSVEPEHLGALRTLQQIVTFLVEKATTPTPAKSLAAPTIIGVSAVVAVPDPVPLARVPEGNTHETTPDAPLDRQILQVTALAPLGEAPLTIAPGHCVLISDDDPALAQALVQEFARAGIPTRTIGINQLPAPGELPIGGLVIAALAQPLTATAWSEASEHFLKHAFLATQAVAADLKSAARRGGAFFATLSRLDGAFGLGGGDLSATDPVPGGLAGLAKTVAAEWPDIRVRALDAAPDWEAEALAPALLREFSQSAPIEVGLTLTGRCTLASVGVELSASAGGDRPGGGVYIVTGGARGVTAQAALALAKAGQSTLVLLGRSPAPQAEAAWLAAFTTEAEIKKALAQRATANGEKSNPRAIGAEYRRISANREVLRTLAELSPFAAAHYRSVDMRDPEAITRTLQEIRSTLGPISGLVHGAGLLEDRLIEDKTLEQFESVFDTKVVGLRALLEATESDPLQFLAFFSSISARRGRRGQVDYAMANEVLNKVAHREAARRPLARVVSLNWGPWDGGMVGPELSREFAKEGVPLIPLRAGAEACVAEIFSGPHGPVEVILGGPKPAHAVTAGRAPIRQSTGSLVSQGIRLQENPYLQSHVLGGRPVLPLAMIVEWFASAAQKAYPQHKFRGVRDLQVLRALSFEKPRVDISIHAQDTPSPSREFELPLELRSGPQGEIVHARGTVRLGAAVEAPTISIDSIQHRNAYPHPVDDAYRNFLFHGADFRGIHGEIGISERGISALVKRAPAPAVWTQQPFDATWITDPLVLDSAFQLAILWCQEKMGAPSLPARLGRYTQFGAFTEDGDLVVSFVVREKTSARVKGDFFIYSLQNAAEHSTLSPAMTPIATIEDYECTVDALLTRAFRSPIVAEREREREI